MSKKKGHDYRIPEGSLERLKQINQSLDELNKQRQQLVNLYNAIGITLMDANGLNPAEWRIDIDSGKIVPIERPKEGPEEAEVVEMIENAKGKDNGTS